MGRLLGFGAAVILVAAAAAPSQVHASAPPGTSCQVFPTDNIWNTDISLLPVHSRSAAWLSSTGATSGRLLHPDFGGPPYGIPFNVVSNSHATANFDFLYWRESDPTVATQQPQGPYPYGPDLQVEGPTDSHLLSINKDTCTLYEIAGTDYNGAHTGWSGAIFDLNSNALRTDTWTSADAAGLPILPGLVRLDEVQAGAINHAIRFTVQQSDTSHLWPARHDAGTASNPNLPPMGARFRLKSSFDISGFNTQAQVVLTAMQHYGLIVADNGSNWYFQGTMDAGWNNQPYATMVSQLKTVPASAFEAVDESALMVDPNSGQAVNQGRCFSAILSPSNPSQPAGSTINFTASSTGCSTPRYAFYVQAPSGTWTLMQPFGGPAFNWDTSGLAPGRYTVHAWVNAQGSGHDSIGSSSVTLTGCISAAVSPPTLTQPAGSTVNLTASSGGCTNPTYEFWVQDPSGTWTLKRGWGGPTLAWDTTGLAAGTYTVHAWANQTGAATTLEAYGTSMVTLSNCSSASVAPPTAAQAAGSTVNLTGSSSGCLSPRYAFYVQDPSGTWTLKQGFGGPAFSWDTTALSPGLYTVHAWVNTTGTGHDAIGSATVTLTGCTTAAVAPPTQSQAAGTTVNLTASAGGGCPNPQFEYYVLYPNGTWNLKRTWGMATFAWDTSGLRPGTYTIHAWSNQTGASTATWEAIGSSTATLTGCTSASVAPPSGSATVGAKVTFTVTAGGCPTPVYEFWLQYPDGTWHLGRGFSTVNSWQWDSAGLGKGNYVIHVWVNNQGADTSFYETIGSATYTLV